MKKKLAIAAILTAGLIYGCAEEGNEVSTNPCGHGTLTNGKCICDVGYQQSVPDGACDTKIGGDQKPDPGTEKCYITFYFTDGMAAGKTVYMVGDFSDWKNSEKYKNYKMTDLGGGTFALKAEVTQNASIEYKFYIDELGDNGWRTTESGDANMKAQFTTCGQEIGNKNGKKYEGDATATISAGSTTPVTPTPTGSDCDITFVYKNKYTDHDNDGNVTTFPVYLVGSFNTEADGTWKVEDPAYKMTSDGNGNQSITIKLKQGQCYEYKYYVSGWDKDSWKTDAADGESNGFANIASCGLTFGDGRTDTSCGGSTNPPSGNTTPTSNCYIKSTPTVANKTISFEIECKDGTTEISSVDGGVSPQKSGLKVTDTVTENNKYSYIVKAGNNEVYVPVWVEDKAFDWHDAFLYFAFTDRFKDGEPGNNEPKTNATVEGSSNAQWMGGDFKGLEEMVNDGYFDRLGVNTLWISSVSMNAQGTSQGTNGDEKHWYSAYHSYWPVSSFMTDANESEFTSMTSEGVKIQAIEPHFGSMADLQSLVNSCHKRGIRVLIDFAANQVHKDSPVFKNHSDWFNDVNSPWLCDSNNGWNNYSEKCWFSQDLPDINYENPDARKAMVDHVEWLIKKTNIDGFRVDAVKHMAVQFLKDMRSKTDQLYYNSGSMFYMVGETFDGDIGKLNQFIGDDMLHAQFDFNLYFSIRDNILNGANLENVRNAYNKAKEYKSDLMGTFMGNHDVARALSIAANQNQNKWGQNEEVTGWEPYFKVKMAWTILLTNPGVPLIYYGDEYGQEGANDPDNRRMMKFNNLNEQQDMQIKFVQQLGQIRREHRALRYGNRNDLSTSAQAWCYTLDDGSEKILVALGLQNGAKCGFNNQTFTLKNLLNPDQDEFQASEITFDDNNKLSVYLVK
ncbi:MAG: hypothetical protein IJU23_06810 [Proteobacteria bacterium]|nr:hypothetical protein [Pseudomonadota bacterium]